MLNKVIEVSKIFLRSAKSVWNYSWKRFKLWSKLFKYIFFPNINYLIINLLWFLNLWLKYSLILSLRLSWWLAFLSNEILNFCWFRFFLVILFIIFLWFILLTNLYNIRNNTLFLRLFFKHYLLFLTVILRLWRRFTRIFITLIRFIHDNL